jgi:hypothetical protein
MAGPVCAAFISDIYETKIAEMLKIGSLIE